VQEQITKYKWMNFRDDASHERAGVGVVVAEERGEALLLPGAGAGGGHEGVHPAHVPRRGPLVVDRRRAVGVGVGHVGPQLDPLLGGLDPPKHPLSLHEPLHRHLLQLPVDLYRLNPCHQIQSSSSPIEIVQYTLFFKWKQKAIIIVLGTKGVHTSHGGEDVPDSELAALTVHPDLQLHRVELLPPPVLPLLAEC
jgi:hypothetical protein